LNWPFIEVQREFDVLQKKIKERVSESSIHRVRCSVLQHVAVCSAVL